MSLLLLSTATGHIAATQHIFSSRSCCRCPLARTCLVPHHMECASARFQRGTFHVPGDHLQSELGKPFTPPCAANRSAAEGGSGCPPRSETSDRSKPDEHAGGEVDLVGVDIVGSEQCTPGEPEQAAIRTTADVNTRYDGRLHTRSWSRLRPVWAR